MITRTQLLDMLMPGLLELFGDGCPTSIKQAKQDGKDFFYPDRMCRNGHLAIRKLNWHCTRCIEDKKK